MIECRQDMNTPQTELPPRSHRTLGERVFIFSGVLCVPAVVLLALRVPLKLEPSPMLDAVIFAPIVEALLGIAMIQIEKMQGKFPPK